MKRLKTLIISFYYLPYTGVGTNRVFRFAKYLSKYGYDVKILAPQRHQGEYDRTCFTEIPTIISKLACIGMKNSTVARYNKKYRTSYTEYISTIFSRFMHLISIPDRQIFWIPFALAKAKRMIVSSKMNLLFTTSPPESSHIIGFILKHTTGIPWIADFRDTWIYDPLNPILEKSKVRLFTDSTLEKIIVRNADGIIVNSEIARSYLETQYLKHKRVPIDIIHTGYDDNYIPKKISRAPEKKLRIVHTGSFGLSRYNIRIGKFLDALLYAVSKQKEMMNDMEVLLVGNLSHSELTEIKNRPLSHIVKVINLVSYAESIKYQASADILLIINHYSDKPTADIPGKFFEYVGAAKPILALTTPGALQRMVEKANGFIASPLDPVEIGENIIEIYNLHKSRRLKGCVNLQLKEELKSKKAALKLIDFMKLVSTND
jgi:glycosyltransferase involved in cell wall biosynthesis